MRNFIFLFVIFLTLAGCSNTLADMDKDTYTLVRDPTDLNAGISSEDTTTTLVSDEIKK